MGNVLVRTLPLEAERTYSLFYDDANYVDVIYSSRLVVTIIDWTSTDNFMPYSSSSSKYLSLYL